MYCMVCNNTACCPTLKMFFKYIFSICFRKFLVIIHSTQVTKVHINMLLSFQIFLTSRAKFSYFPVFSASPLERLWVMGTTISVTNAALFFLLDVISGLFKSNIPSFMIGLSQY